MLFLIENFQVLTVQTNIRTLRFCELQYGNQQKIKTE